MAMELFVLSDTQLNSIEAWQVSIDGERYPLQLDNARPIEALKGFLAARLRGVKTGFECGHWLAEEFMREMADVDFGHPWKCVLAFRWGGDFDELQAAWMAAAAYAKATSGIVFDDEEGKIRTAAQAREAVQDIERSMPTVEAILQEVKKR